MWPKKRKRRAYAREVKNGKELTRQENYWAALYTKVKIEKYVVEGNKYFI